jgi:hypothetical protein
VFFNGKSLGVAAEDMPCAVYLVVELYGKCTAVGLSEDPDANNSCFQQTPLARKFHPRCRGVNVVLSHDGMVATRKDAERDYANGVVLTDRPLEVDELFLVEIAGQVRNLFVVGTNGWDASWFLFFFCLFFSNGYLTSR